MFPPTIRTPRLVLDGLTPDDAASVAAFCSDPELQGNVPVPVPYTREHADDYCINYTKRSAEGGGALWAIRWADAPGSLRGVVELKPEPLASADLGFWLGAPHRGAGIMTEAAAAVCDWGLSAEGMALMRIFWRAVVGNVGSASVARRCGFHFEGTWRGSLPHRDRRLGGWRGSLLATDARQPASGWPEGVR